MQLQVLGFTVRTLQEVCLSLACEFMLECMVIKFNQLGRGVGGVLINDKQV